MSAHHKGYPANLNGLDLIRAERERIDTLRASLAAEFERFDAIVAGATDAINFIRDAVPEAGKCIGRIRTQIHVASLQAEIAEADQAGRAL